MIVYYSEGTSNFGDYLVPLSHERTGTDDTFRLTNKKLFPSPLLRCPAHAKVFDSFFVVKSPYSYQILWENEVFSSPDYDQFFWDKHVYARDSKTGLISFRAPELWLFCEKDLEVELLPAFWHKNEVTTKTSVIGGRYNIGGQFRPLECAMAFDRPGKLKIFRNTALYYLRFNTYEKIKFVPFQMTEDLSNFASGALKTTAYNKDKPRILSQVYLTNKLFYKKRLLKLIKNNLL